MVIFFYIICTFLLKNVHFYTDYIENNDNLWSFFCINLYFCLATTQLFSKDAFCFGSQQKCYKEFAVYIQY